MNQPRSSPNSLGSISTTSAMRCGMNFIDSENIDAQQVAQVLAIAALAQPRRQPFQLRRVDQAEAVGDLLGTGDLQALALLDGLHVLAGLEQRIVGAGIQPGVAAA